MDGLRFYILFNRISVISGGGGRVGDNERLFAMEPQVR